MKMDTTANPPREVGLLPVFPVVEISVLSIFAKQPPAGGRDREISDEGADASVRLLVRLVPIVYAALLGLTGGNLFAWLGAGVVASLAFDLWTGPDSLLRAAGRCLMPWRRRSPEVCPLDATRR